MTNDLKSEETTISQRVGSRRTGAAIFMTGLLLLLSVALLGAREARSPSSQASPGAASQNTATVPAGTRMMVKMIDPVDSETSRPNDRFRGALEANLMAGNVLVAPKGTTVFGRLLSAESAGRTAGGQLELDITEIVIDGTSHSLRTSSNQVQGQEGESTASQTARGAGTGAAVGAVVGTGVGFGARAGAIAGNVAGGSTRGEKVKVPAGALVEFTLDHPVSLPVAK
jgi:hypothetical protein